MPVLSGLPDRDQLFVNNVVKSGMVELLIIKVRSVQCLVRNTL